MLFVYLSVCYTRFVDSELQCCRQFIFYEEDTHTLVNDGVILISKGQMSRSWRRKMWKSFCAHIFAKSMSIYIKRRPKWSLAHSTHIVKYIASAEMRSFCNISVYLSICHTLFVYFRIGMPYKLESSCFMVDYYLHEWITTGMYITCFLYGIISYCIAFYIMYTVIHNILAAS